MSDDLISAERIKYEKLCARLAVQKASEHEAVGAIHQLCDENERLAVICGRRAAEITRLRAMVDLLTKVKRAAAELEAGLGIPNAKVGSLRVKLAAALATYQQKREGGE